MHLGANIKKLVKIVCQGGPILAHICALVVEAPKLGLWVFGTAQPGFEYFCLAPSFFFEGPLVPFREVDPSGNHQQPGETAGF